MQGVIPVSGDRGTADRRDSSARQRCHCTGTHSGVLFGVPAGGNRIEADGTTVLRFRGDRVVERRNRLDDIAFRSRIGAN